MNEEEITVEETAPEEASAEPNELLEELEALRAELKTTKDFYERLEGECAEFASLYPEVSISSLPDSVWQSMRAGVPLSAAYALEERRAAVKARRAGVINRENSQMSAGALSRDGYNDYFSPDEVKAMTPSEVRANYTKIINSMPKWH